ncbi:MAG: malate dehydrogenase, partial [archaeon]
VITLTNPLDTMNYLMWKLSGLDRRRVLGSAGMLDSARFRNVLSGRCRTPVLDVDAYVIGEHGDNQVPVFSQVKIRGEKKTFSGQEKLEIVDELRNYALKVIAKKGRTIYAPANNTANMGQSILRNERRLTVCSMVLDGEYGLKNVSIGVPVILGRDGAEETTEWDLDEQEKRDFYKGAESLRKTINEIAPHVA